MRVFTRQMAEELVVGHMALCGFADVRRADGGDVLASSANANANAIARVSDSATPVDEPMVQLFRGAAYGVEHVRFYSASGFTARAVISASRAGVELFVWDEQLMVTPVSDLVPPSPESVLDFAPVFARGKAISKKLSYVQPEVVRISSTIRLVQQSLMGLRSGVEIDGVPAAPREFAEAHSAAVLAASVELVALSTLFVQTVEGLTSDVAAEISAAREHGGLARAEAAMTVTEERVAGLEQMWAEEIRGIDERVTAAAMNFGLV